jgi:malate dehydrogenase (oxaloacetate-decarboxylating)(NADP+)
MTTMTKTVDKESLKDLAGLTLLNDPAHNKGTAFTEEERRRFGLEGFLPHAVESLDRQVERSRRWPYRTRSCRSR